MSAISNKKLNELLTAVPINLDVDRRSLRQRDLRSSIETWNRHERFLIDPEKAVSGAIETVKLYETNKTWEKRDGVFQPGDSLVDNAYVLPGKPDWQRSFDLHLDGRATCWIEQERTSLSRLADFGLKFATRAAFREDVQWYLQEYLDHPSDNVLHILEGVTPPSYIPIALAFSLGELPRHHDIVCHSDSDRIWRDATFKDDKALYTHFVSPSAHTSPINNYPIGYHYLYSGSALSAKGGLFKRCAQHDNYKNHLVKVLKKDGSVAYKTPSAHYQALDGLIDDNRINQLHQLPGHYSSLSMTEADWVPPPLPAPLTAHPPRSDGFYARSTYDLSSLSPGLSYLFESVRNLTIRSASGAPLLAFLRHSGDDDSADVLAQSGFNGSAPAMGFGAVAGNIGAETFDAVGNSRFDSDAQAERGRKGALASKGKRQTARSRKHQTNQAADPNGYKQIMRDMAKLRNDGERRKMFDELKNGERLAKPSNGQVTIFSKPGLAHRKVRISKANPEESVEAVHKLVQVGDDFFARITFKVDDVYDPTTSWQLSMDLISGNKLANTGTILRSYMATPDMRFKSNQPKGKKLAPKNGLRDNDVRILDRLGESYFTESSKEQCNELSKEVAMHELGLVGDSAVLTAEEEVNLEEPETEEEDSEESSDDEDDEDDEDLSMGMSIAASTGSGMRVDSE